MAVTSWWGLQSFRMEDLQRHINSSALAIAFVSCYKGKGIPWVCGNWQCLFWDPLQTVYPGGVFWVFKAEVNKKWWKMLAKSWLDSLCAFRNLNKTFLLIQYLLCSSLPSLYPPSYCKGRLQRRTYSPVVFLWSSGEIGRKTTKKNMWKGVKPKWNN